MSIKKPKTLDTEAILKSAETKLKATSPSSLISILRQRGIDVPEESIGELSQLMSELIRLENFVTEEKPTNYQQTGSRPTLSTSSKNYTEYEQTRPIQLDLFQMVLPEEQKFSNTVELYDFVPKYQWGKSNRIEGRFLNLLERKFECRGASYRVIIKPARLIGPDGKGRDYFPGAREELVEDALRKLASEGGAVFLDDQASVTFTLYQLQQELQSMGHTYSFAQIKDALLICAQTGIELHSGNGQAMLISNMFETLGFHIPDAEEEGGGKKVRVFVRFNSLVTNSIKQGTFRKLNYEKSMSYRNVLARQLHKRMAHHYTQASIAHPYQILLTTLIRDFGLTFYERLSMNLRDAILAFDEMVEQEVILQYEVVKTLEGKRKGLREAKFIIIPHPLFVSEVMQANHRQARVKEILLGT
jgi:hypothetical protein